MDRHVVAIVDEARTCSCRLQGNVAVVATELLSLI